MVPVTRQMKPVRRITSQEDLPAFERSPAFRILTAYLSRLSTAVTGKPVSWAREHLSQASESIQKTVALLDEIDRWTDEIEPIQQPQRYGNKAFREWHARLVSRAQSLVETHLAGAGTFDPLEAASYLHVAFGNETRIDYGTGHEAAFFAFLVVLMESGVFHMPNDEPFIVLIIFTRYLQLMRRLFARYMLEPAGSHGVWGLDDYHFLPYLFGASQLIGNAPGIRTEDIHNKRLVEEMGDEYLYLGCIRTIHRVKKGPFFEHSPMLNDISAVPSWEKTAQGMHKMYRAEVLLKFPVIQHFLFGSVLTFTE